MMEMLLVEVAWEGLIDALIVPAVQLFGSSEGNNTQTEAERHSKRIKLIMAPLVIIMSRKCEVSILASCLSTWSYLVHKLEAYVSSQLVIKIVWEPITEAVFRVGPDNKNIWLWNFCLDLFENLILGRNQGSVNSISNQEKGQLSVKNSIDCSLAFGKRLLRHYEINCSPWKLCELDFFLKTISILVNQGSKATVTPEFGRLANDAALRLFRSLMETVQSTLRCDSINYNEVIQCLDAIFRFLQKMCGNITLEDDSTYYCPHTCLKFLKVVTETLEPSILECPLYKVSLDISCIKKLECSTEIRCATVPGICFVEDFEDRVIAIVYLNVLYFSVVVNSYLRAPECESLLHHMQGYLKFVLSSYDPEEVLHAFLCLLYKNTMFISLHIWVVTVNCLQECIDGKRDQLLLKKERESIGYSVVLHLLSYPFASWPFSHNKLELQSVSEIWNILYVSVDQALQSVYYAAKSFSEDLCALLNGCINQITSAVDTRAELQVKAKNCYGEFVLLCGNAIICVLKQFAWSVNSKDSHLVDYDGRKSSIMNSMMLVARFMKLFWANMEVTEPSYLCMASRFLSELANFVGCLHQKEDVLMLVESTSSPLLEWLSEMHLLDENARYQLQLLWTEILKGLQKSELSLKFNSSFLEFQEPLLERTLDHPNPGISEATINFWNSTYGAQHKLEFPKKLLPVLDKLSRNGKIKICNRNYYVEESISSLQKYKVTTTLKKCSKRVEILGNPINGSQYLDNICSGSKRKWPELTEHQRGVRRARQGLARDCNGHGPGI